MATASDAVKELAALCKASDSVLEKINELHGKLYKAGLFSFLHTDLNRRAPCDCGFKAAPAEREAELERQYQKLRTMYQRAKDLAEQVLNLKENLP